MSDGIREAPARTIDAPQVSEWIVLANARRICGQRFKRLPNWSLAMEAFGLGSTWARALCLRVGVDPDGRTMEPCKENSELDWLGQKMPAGLVNIQAGKFYRSKDGRKIGPMEKWGSGDTSNPWQQRGESFLYTNGGDLWRPNGTSDYTGESGFLISEWEDEKLVGSGRTLADANSKSPIQAREE